jgi:hypothetical protein
MKPNYPIVFMAVFTLFLAALLGILMANGFLQPEANAESTPYPTIPAVDASENCEQVLSSSYFGRSAMTLCTFPDGLQCVAFSGGGVSCDWDHRGE